MRINSVCTGDTQPGCHSTMLQ